MSKNVLPASVKRRIPLIIRNIRQTKIAEQSRPVLGDKK
jgi:hypothetical protein